MATINGSGGVDEAGTYDYQWGSGSNVFAASGDVGTPFKVPAFMRELTVQTTGTFTGSLAIQLQGSNDGTNYSQLSDVANAAISMTTTAIVRVNNPPKYIKPVATAGSGGAAASVFLHGIGMR